MHQVKFFILPIILLKNVIIYSVLCTFDLKLPCRCPSSNAGNLKMVGTVSVECLNFSQSILLHNAKISLRFYFSMQVVINKCFLPNPEKSGADSSCRFKEKRIFIMKK